MFGLFEPGHLIVIFCLVLVLFGPNRLPELARGLGKAVREMRKLASEFQLQFNDYVDDAKPRSQPPIRYEPPKQTESAWPQPAPDSEATSYEPLHPAVPEYGVEKPAIVTPETTPSAVELERTPLPAQVIENGQTIPRQKPSPRPDAP